MSSKYKLIAEFIRVSRKFIYVSLDINTKKNVWIPNETKTLIHRHEVERKEPQYFINIRYDELLLIGSGRRKNVPDSLLFIGNHINNELAKNSKRAKPLRKIKHQRVGDIIKTPLAVMYSQWDGRPTIELSNMLIFITQAEYQKLKATGLFPMDIHRFVNSP